MDSRVKQEKIIAAVLRNGFGYLIPMTKHGEGAHYLEKFKERFTLPDKDSRNMFHRGLFMAATDKDFKIVKNLEAYLIACAADQFDMDKRDVFDYDSSADFYDALRDDPNDPFAKHPEYGYDILMAQSIAERNNIRVAMENGHTFKIKIYERECKRALYMGDYGVNKNPGHLRKSFLNQAAYPKYMAMYETILRNKTKLPEEKTD